MRALTERSWRILHSPPPYIEELALPEPPRRPKGYSFLILDLPDGEIDLVYLRHAIEALRLLFALPLFVRTGPGDNSTRAGLRRAVINTGGELLLPSEAIGTRARIVLTERRDLAGDWIRWIHLQGGLSPRGETALRVLFRDSRKADTVEEALADTDIAYSTLQHWLAESHLPAAGTCLRACRVLRVLLLLQRESDLGVEEAAKRFGYAGSDGLSNAMFRYFRHTAKQGRALLGLEPRFRAFDTRVGRTPS